MDDRYVFSNEEQELSDLVKGICRHKDTYIGVMLAACIYGFVEETIAIIKEKPDIDEEELVFFISERVPDDETDDEPDETFSV